MLGKLNGNLQHILFIYRNSGILCEKGSNIFLSETSLFISVFSKSGVGGFSMEDHGPHTERAACWGLASRRDSATRGSPALDSQQAWLNPGWTEPQGAFSVPKGD